MAGILRYGSYVPYWRIRRSLLGSRLPGERAVAGFDEDATSMAVEAGREALRGGSAVPTHLVLASTSHPYAEKLNAAVLHAALDLPPEVRSFDLASTSRAGLAALALAARQGAEENTLVCASDVVIGAPMGPRESAGGDAACAFLVGEGEDAVARILGTASRTVELLDVWRGHEQPFARQWEERFVMARLLPALKSVLLDSLAEAGLRVADLARVVVDGAHPKLTTALARALSLEPGQVSDNPASSIGRAGAAHAGLALASLLDKAEPGERIAVLCAADGAEALVVETTDALQERRPRRSVSRWIASGRSDLAYPTYLKWREVLPFEPPRRPDPARPAAPPMQRSERWKYAFVGSRCRSCGAVNLPPQRVCVQCGSVDTMVEVPYADAVARVATYTVDHLAYSLQQPVVAAVVDFEQGGRLGCELTDVEPDSLAIGSELEMTFRRLYTADGVRNYFWKARPRR